MESVIDQRIDYNGLGALRGQRYIYTQQKLTHVPPLGCLAAVTTEITAAKETRLFMHSSNCKWPLELQF